MEQVGQTGPQMRTAGHEKGVITRVETLRRCMWDVLGAHAACMHLGSIPTAAHRRCFIPQSKIARST